MIRAINLILGLVKTSLIKVFHAKRFVIKGIVKVHPSAQIELLSGGKIILGSRCSIGKDAEIASVSGNVVIGNNVHIGDFCMIIARDNIEIGDNTIFGPHIYIYDHDHAVDDIGVVKRSEYKTKPVTIGSNVWVGTNTVILKGTNIGDGCIIGAGSVISGTIPPHTKVVQKRFNRENEGKI